MPTKRNYLVKVLDAKIVDVKRALEAKGIKLESIYEMYKETMEPEKVATPDSSDKSAPPGPGQTPQPDGKSAPAAASPSASPSEPKKPTVGEPASTPPSTTQK